MSTRNLLAFAFACAVALLPARSFAQTSRPDLEKQVLKAESDLNSAETHSDIAGMERLYADDYTHTHTSGQIQPKADFIDGFKTGQRKYSSIEVVDTKVRFYSDATAIVTGHLKLASNGNPAAEQPDSFLEIWVKDKGMWRCAASAQTRPPAKKN